MKDLTEQLQMDAAPLGEQWELPTVVSYLKALLMVHHTHHLMSSSDTSYGDHLLFKRVYDGIFDEADGLAERSTLKGGVDSVVPSVQMRQQYRIVREFASVWDHYTNQRDIARASLEAEQSFLATLKRARASLEQKGRLSHGLANLLDGISDSHEAKEGLLENRLGSYGGVKLAASWDTSVEENPHASEMEAIKLNRLAEDASEHMKAARNSLVEARKFAGTTEEGILRAVETHVAAAIKGLNPLI